MPVYAQFVDLEMWFYLLEQGRFAYLAEPLASFRDHPGQQTKVNMRRMLHIDESFLLLRDFAEKPYMRFSAFTRWYLTYSQGYRIWKLHRQGLISREIAEARISKTYRNGEFSPLSSYLQDLQSPVQTPREPSSGLSWSLDKGEGNSMLEVIML